MSETKKGNYIIKRRKSIKKRGFFITEEKRV